MNASRIHARILARASMGSANTPATVLEPDIKAQRVMKTSTNVRFLRCASMLSAAKIRSVRTTAAVRKVCAKLVRQKQFLVWLCIFADYMGPKCDVRNPCLSNTTHTCQNSGRCVNARVVMDKTAGAGGFRVTYDCDCVDGFHGDYCQIAVSEDGTPEQLLRKGSGAKDVFFSETGGQGRSRWSSRVYPGSSSRRIRRGSNYRCGGAFRCCPEEQEGDAWNV